MRKKCSSDREKLFKFEAEGQEFTKILLLLKQFIYTESSKQFFKQNTFLTYYGRFLGSNAYRNKLEKHIKIISLG